ncbi:MAG: nitroreductase family protein [Chloroflexi bacterium]|nr:nitroreductase family protein [Chloroflexota bacterium]MDA1239695.1 nitroreductase family protein [Chloroflexota bacterium]
MQPITDAMDLFRHQRAVRDWSDRPVTDDDLRIVLQAALHAPSGSNTQPWRFVVVRDQAVKDAISDEYEAAQTGDSAAPAARQPSGSGTLSRAPVLIVPCVQVPARTGRAGFQTGASVYPACQNLMLAARAVGLGTVMTTRHRIRRAQIHAILRIPEGYDTAAIIPLGWPDRAYGPNRRAPLDEFLVYDRWPE